MSEGEGEGSCTPKSHGRSVRGIDCDMCWAGWIPYPCNCNCRGWEQVTVDCWKPCSHYNDEYTQTVGYHCWKPYDREGQIMFNVGCGLTPLDRTCASSTGDCIMKYVNHAISILDVLTSILSGGVAGALKAAAKTAAKAGSKTLAKAGLRAALKAAGKEFAQKLLKSNDIKRKMRKYASKTRKELKNQVVEQGSELFLAASMNTEPDWGGMIDEIAEALDPTGIYSLVKGFIPPDSCDDSVYMDEDIPDEEDGLPELDPLDIIDDIDLKNIAVNPSYLLNDCEGDCDSDSGCKSGKCFQRKHGSPDPPGCNGTPHADWDYCIPVAVTEGMYHIQISGGTSGGFGGRQLLSTTSDRRKVYLIPFSDNSGHQKWFIQRIPGTDFFHIIGGTRGGWFGAQLLSTTSDGREVDVYSHDDNSGRQKWAIQRIPGTDFFHISISGGTSGGLGGQQLLSTTSDGRKVDLYSRDDNSGRQKWRLYKV